MTSAALPHRRRQFLKRTASIAAVAGSGSLMSHKAFAANKTLNIGMNVPKTGDYAPWGLPGVYGCEIIASDINAKGGVRIGDDVFEVRLCMKRG